MIQSKSDLNDEGMYNTFNMGIGMTLIVSDTDSENVLELLKSIDAEAYEIGRIETRKENEDGICFE